MMPWLLVSILAYFFLALASLGDRFLLIGPLPSPRVYAFSIAVLGGLIIPFLLPFGFSIPDLKIIILALAGGFIWASALVAYFEAIIRLEVSRVVPAVGAFVPIFTLGGTALFLQEMLFWPEFVAFLLLTGGVLITLRDSKILLKGYFSQKADLGWILLSALMFAVSFLITKQVFLAESFINGFIWMRFGGLFLAILLLAFSDVRNSVVAQKVMLQRKVLIPFIGAQSAGGIGFVLQNLAVALAKTSQIPLVNALEGTRYLFLFIFVWLLSYLKPEFLKEDMRGRVFWQKIISGVIIISGIVFLALFK